MTNTKNNVTQKNNKMRFLLCYQDVCLDLVVQGSGTEEVWSQKR